MSVLIWVQTVWKGNKQTTRVTTSEEFPKRLNNRMSDAVMTSIKGPGK